VGKCSSTLGFEVVSGERLVAVPIEGTCEHPHISADYRNVFYRKVGAHTHTHTHISADYRNVFYRKVGGQRSFISSVGGLFVIGWVSGLVGGFV